MTKPKKTALELALEHWDLINPVIQHRKAIINAFLEEQEASERNLFVNGFVYGYKYGKENGKEK